MIAVNVKKSKKKKTKKTIQSEQCPRWLNDIFKKMYVGVCDITKISGYM